MQGHTSRIVALCALATLAISCSDTRLQRTPPPEPEPLDNLLEIKGEFCTEPSATVEFPLKVLFLVDQSNSLQFTDAADLRIEALNAAFETLRRRPATEFAYLGFSSWSRVAPFTRDESAFNDIRNPEGGLGPATDYQGALATALAMIEEDIRESGPAERARTRYIINFISDGVPGPACLAGCEDDIFNCEDGDDNDGDGLADGADPDCDNINDNSLHPDNLSFGVCNTIDREAFGNDYADMQGVCPEYNQPRQIQQRIREILDLEQAYSVGDISLNTILLFSTEIPRIGNDVAARDFGLERNAAKALLQAMANTGNGTFRDVNTATADQDFLSFEVSSIQADQTLTLMTVENEHSRRSSQGVLEPDQDRDGLSDALELELGTDRNRRDSDGDNFQDLFEVTYEREGFDPLDDTRPAVTCEDRRDGDGDGLNDCEEAFIETSPNQPDTDGDGILDRDELIAGLDPLQADGLTDLDFDGVVNIEEYRGGTDPLQPDDGLYRSDRIVYDVEEIGLLDLERANGNGTEERRCYDYSLERIPLVATPLVRDRGLNRILVKSSERAARVSGVPNEVRVACFEAFYNGETIKTPADGVIDVTPERLEQLRVSLSQKLVTVSACPYFGPPNEDPDAPASLVARGELTGMMAECMPQRVEIDGILYKRDQLDELIRRHIDPEGFARVPERSYELFVPIQNFDPDDDCWRPWELDQIDRLLDDVAASCNACVEEMAAEADDT